MSSLVEFHQAIKINFETKLQNSSLQNNLSNHTMSDTLTLAHLRKFQKVSETFGHSKHSFVGTVSGELMLSLNLKVEDTQKLSKKRQRSSSNEDAEYALAKIKKANSQALEKHTVGCDVLEAAGRCVQNVLNMRGSGNERVLESYAVSIRKAGTWGNRDENEPTLIVGFRLIGGFAHSLFQICDILSESHDGILTIDANIVEKHFDLPLSEQAKAAQQSGQKSVICLASFSSKLKKE